MVRRLGRCLALSALVYYMFADQSLRAFLVPERHQQNKCRVVGAASLRGFAVVGRKPLHSAVARSASVATASSVTDIKISMLQIAALTDRGQRHNALIAPTEQDKKEAMAQLISRLAQQPCTVSEDTLAGEWELVYSDVELFRSSPFFLAIEDALNSAPGIPLLGQWLGCTDPTKKAEVFFKLHQLQVLSFGISTVGRIAQRVDFKSGTLESSFDTTIFGLTVIPIFGWFKLLPTFGGRVITEADGLTLDSDGALCMELQQSMVKTAPGLERIPFVDQVFMDRWYPVNWIWKLLPWNGGPFEGRAPLCKMSTVYVDDSMRVSRDGSGGTFVYTRPLDL